MQLPTTLPRVIYVMDFALDMQDYSGDKGAQGVLPQRLQQGAIGAVLGSRLPHPLAGKDPARQSRELIEQMSQSVVNRLRQEGIAAQRVMGADPALPAEGWLVRGIFHEVVEGNRLKRSAIGLGQGATRMEVSVSVSDLAETVQAPFLVFGTVKDPSRLPGGAATSIVTKTPYAAAARFVMERNAAPKDIEKTAEQIVGEIMKYRNRIEGR